MQLIEGEELDLYVTEYNEADMQRMRAFVAKYTRLPGILDAKIVKKSERKPDDQTNTL